jgi:uroporphyrinogen-III synthase
VAPSRYQPQLRAQEPTTDGIVALLSGLDLRGRRVGVPLYPGSGDRLVAFLEGAGAAPDSVTPYECASHVADEILGANRSAGCRRDRCRRADQRAAGSRLFDVAPSHGCAD